MPYRCAYIHHIRGPSSAARLQLCPLPECIWCAHSPIQATLHLGEEEGSLLTGLRSGQCAVLHLPLYPPQPDAPTKNTVRTSLERARSSSGADVPVRQPIAAHVSEGQAVEATQGTSEECTVSDVQCGYAGAWVCVRVRLRVCKEQWMWTCCR